VYGGYDSEKTSTNKAIAATVGQIRLYKGKPGPAAAAVVVDLVPRLGRLICQHRLFLVLVAEALTGTSWDG